MSETSIERFEVARELTKGEEKLFNSEGIKPAWQPLRQELLDGFRAERPDCDVLTLLTLERITFIYVKMRQMEAAGTLTTADHKTFMSMYNELIGALNKIDEKQQSLEKMKAEAVQMMVATLTQATASLPDGQRREVMSKFMGEVE